LIQDGLASGSIDQPTNHPPTNPSISNSQGEIYHLFFFFFGGEVEGEGEGAERCGL
jgi:hypothetical protein